MKIYPLLLLLIGLETTFAQSQSPKTLQPLPKLTTAGKPSAVRPRNVIFILADDHRYDFMSFMKPAIAPWLETPNLDRIRREGAHCPKAFVTTALCSPSRASILTGLYSHQHTVVDNVAPEPPTLTYFPQYLQQAGYQTAFVGKWHMGNEDDRPRRGFNHWVSFRGQGVYYNPTLNVDGKQVSHGDSAYTTDVLTDYAVNWMKGRDQAKPFFLYLSHKAVHHQFNPGRDDRNRYAGKPIQYPPSFYQSSPKNENPETDPSGVPNWVKRQRYSWHGVDYLYHGTTTFDAFVRDYCETLRSLDASIGRVLKYLDDNGLAQSTLVVYMGDNGFMFGEHGLIDKRTAYEESMRVPLLMRCPELIQAGSTVPQLVQNVDIAPTILELAGLQKAPPMVGRSMVPLLKGQAVADWRDRIFYEYYWEYDFPHTPTVHAVRTDRYKYVRYHGIWDTNEFFDLQADPHEMPNLIKVPQHQPTIRQMAGQLYDWLEGTEGMQIPLKRTIKPRSGDHENKGTF
ncbi:MAG: sulfatase [Cytophagaceae bacterium]|nr:sulfatase [Cytophagaceae bacterium]